MGEAQKTGFNFIISSQIRMMLAKMVSEGMKPASFKETGVEVFEKLHLKVRTGNTAICRQPPVIR